MCVCVCLHAQQGRSSCGATDSECFALLKSSEGTVTHGFWVAMNKTVSLVFLLDWPLLMAPGYSSSVLMWKAAATVEHDSCPLRPSHIKNRGSLWPVFALSLSCWLSLFSLPSLLSSPPHAATIAERAPDCPSWVFVDAGSWAGRDGGATSLSHRLSFSPPPTPKHLLHHCSATINSSAQISCKLPKQTSVATSAPQCTHAHRSPKFKAPREHQQQQPTHTHTHTPRAAV